MEGCPVYASIVTLRPEQENTNFIQTNNKLHSFNPNCTLQHKDRVQFFYGITTTFLPPEHASLLHQRPQTGRHQRCHAPPCPQHPETSSSSSDLEATFTVRHTQGTVYKLHRNTHIPGREERGTTLKLLLKNTFVISDSKHTNILLGC